MWYNNKPLADADNGMIGCTCYFNAIIQVLFHNISIRNAIFNMTPTGLSPLTKVNINQILPCLVKCHSFLSCLREGDWSSTNCIRTHAARGKVHLSPLWNNHVAWYWLLYFIFRPSSFFLAPLSLYIYLSISHTLTHIHTHLYTYLMLMDCCLIRQHFID